MSELLNKKIKTNLLRLLNEVKVPLMGKSFKNHLLDQILINPPTLNFDTNQVVDLFSEEDVLLLKKASKDADLNNAFNEIFNFNAEHLSLLETVKEDLNNCLNLNWQKYLYEKKAFKIQGIFINYDYLPESWMSFYGPSDYPVLEKPSNFNFDHSDYAFDKNAKIQLDLVWKKLIHFKNLVAEFDDLEDTLFDTEFFYLLADCFKYQWYILFHNAFTMLDPKLTKDWKKELPIFVYINEHDTKPINLFVLE